VTPSDPDVIKAVLLARLVRFVEDQYRVMFFGHPVGGTYTIVAVSVVATVRSVD